jgi:hypothetical protein
VYEGKASRAGTTKPFLSSRARSVPASATRRVTSARRSGGFLWSQGVTVASPGRPRGAARMAASARATLLSATAQASLGSG